MTKKKYSLLGLIWREKILVENDLLPTKNKSGFMKRPGQRV
jgi:hypothetical protein